MIVKKLPYMFSEFGANYIDFNHLNKQDKRDKHNYDSAIHQ